MRILALTSLSLALFLASCGKKPEPAGETPAAETPAASLVLPPATPLAEIECAADRLPVTGACPDANPLQFLKISDQVQTFTPQCRWITRELQTSLDEALLFRSQDCSGQGWDIPAYAWAETEFGGQVLTGPRPDDATRPVLDVWRLTSGMSLKTIAMETLSTAAETERSRCILVPLTDPVAPGQSFSLQPNAELMKQLDMQHGGDVYEACGTYGLNDSAQMWEGRRTRVLFHFLGQDQGDWDYGSFTFYRRGSDGVWSRDE